MPTNDLVSVEPVSPSTNGAKASVERVRLSISQHFLNKDNRAPMRPDKETGELQNRWAYGAFNNAILTPDELIRHVTTGKAICVSALSTNWRKEANFLSGQLMGVDFDNGPDVNGLLRDPFVDDHAFLVYRTPSWTIEQPRTRALFMLDHAITDPAQYRIFIKRLLLRFANATVDDGCKDPVRIFYGSDRDGYSAVPNARLSIDALVALPPHPDEAPKSPTNDLYPRRPVDFSNAKDATRAERYAIVTRDNLIAEALATPVGAHERHKAFNALCMQFAARVLGGWPEFENSKAILESVGYQMGRDKDEIERGIAGAWVKATPKDLSLPERDADPTTPSKPSLYDGLQDDRPESLKVEQAVAAEPLTPNPMRKVTWRTSDESLDEYKRSLHEAPTEGQAPLLFPFRQLGASGGFCRIVPAGILIGVVGLSGGMKTSFVETITDKWRQMDANDVLWWGPEWDWKKISDRAIQRHGGAPMEDVLLHRLWLSEKEQGIPREKRMGRELTANMLKLSIQTADAIKQWPGKCHYVEEMDIDIPDLLAASAERLTEAKAMGRNIRIAVWDYVQLLNLRSVRTEMERITQVLGLLKAFCVENQLIGIIASQVTKANASEVRDGSKTLDADAGQFQRSDKFNLVLTLNPVYSGEMLTNKGVIRVAKNSIGKPISCPVIIDPSKFLWVDAPAELKPSDRISDVEF